MQSSHATYPRTRCIRKMIAGDILASCSHRITYIIPLIHKKVTRLNGVSPAVSSSHSRYHGPQPALSFVISTGAKRRGEICGLPFPQPLSRATTALAFVISTGAKRSGEICGLLPTAAVAGHNHPLLCHLDRSEAQWRDLRFSPSHSLY